MSDNRPNSLNGEARKPLTLGIWLEYSPVQSLTGEGISRLISWLLLPMSQSPDVRIVIAMAKWSEKDIRELLQDYHIDLDRVEIVTSRRRIPLLVRTMLWVRDRKKRRRTRKDRFFYRLSARLWSNPIVGGSLRLMLMTDSYILAILLALLSMMLLPLALITAFFGAIGWELSKSRRARNIWRKSARHARDQWHQFKSSPRLFTYINVWKSLEEQEFRRLARRASRRTDVQVWYTPNASATHVISLPRPLVTAVPDLVYLDFVSDFRSDWVCRIDGRIRRLAAAADRTISYNNDVRDRHVVRHLGVSPRSARVIRHGAVDAGADLREQTLRHSGDSRAAALGIIHLYFRLKYAKGFWTSRLPTGYFFDFPFDEIPYLFVSSQIRPNKNFLNLLRAYEFLLRRKYRNLKLVITGDLISERLGLKNFIHERGLDLDILSLPNLPLDVHAAFYHLATLTVVPTLFEGGFPFQFSESMSVGTPVVMSDIAATRELLPAHLVDRMLFDPTDPQSMAARIEWALDNRAALLDLQKPFYENMKTRTWDKVAGEYLDVFREVAAGSAKR